tara:strand:+ start:1534 stop:1758 length:225 start_codon:yes stop_codon:yes gene_type:complete
MTSPSEERLLKIAELTEWLGISHSTIYKWVNDGSFPKPLVLGDTGAKNSSTRWIEAEIVEWLATRPRSKVTPNV